MLAFFAILFGLAGTYVLRVYRREPPAVVAPPPPEKKIVRITVPLASRDIASGTQITLDDVALYKMTREEMMQVMANKDAEKLTYFDFQKIILDF